MTTPKPDETKALIAKARNPEEPYTLGLYGMIHDLADALARDHAIVERVTRIVGYWKDSPDQQVQYFIEHLHNAFNPPAEQPPRSETRFCGVKMDIGGVEVACTGELPCETHSRETPAVAKCDRLIVSDRLCNNSAGHDGDCSYTAPPAAQPKPSPDNVARAKASFGAVLAKKHSSDCDIDLLWEAITKARS